MTTLDDINIDLSLVDGEEFVDPSIDRSMFLNNSLEGGECYSDPSQPSGLVSLGGVAHDLCVTDNFFETVEGEMISKPGAIETKREVERPKVRRVPCPARGMPPTHNAATAFLTLKPEVKHGDELTCSYPDCQKLGVKFRYCAMCKVPVSKRNFRSRHSHRKSVSGEEIAISSKVHAPLWAEKQKKNGRGRSLERAKGSAPPSVPLVVTTAGTAKGKGEEATEFMIPLSAENGRRESAISASSMLMASMSSFTSIFDDDDDKDGQKKGRHIRDQSIASIDSVELMKVIGGTETDGVHEASGSVHSSLFDGSFNNSHHFNPLTHFNRRRSSNSPHTSQNGGQVSPVHEKQPVNVFAQAKGSEAEVSCGQSKSLNPTMNVPTGQPIGNMFNNLNMSSGSILSTQSPPDLFQEFLHEFREKRQVDVQCNASLTQKPPLFLETNDRNKHAAKAVKQEGLDHLLGNDDDVSIGTIDGSLSGIFDFTDSNTFDVIQPSTGNGFQPPTEIQTHQKTQHQPNNLHSLRKETFKNGNFQPPSLPMHQGNNGNAMIQGNNPCRENIQVSMGQGNIQTSMGQELNKVLTSQIAFDQGIARISNNATFDGSTSIGSGMINAQVRSTTQFFPYQLINDPLIGNITNCMASIQPHVLPTNETNREAVGPTRNVPSLGTGNVALNSTTNPVNFMIPKQSTPRAHEPKVINITPFRTGETNQTSAISKEGVDEKTDLKKRITNKQEPVPEPENVTLVGMGFFSQLEEMGLKNVKGVTQTKKKKITRKRKPKPDLLKNVSMGFFSCQIEQDSEAEEKPKRRLVETNHIAQPQQSDGSPSMSALYNWAPTVDERARFAMEYSLPIVVPGVAILSKYSSYAFWYCLLLPIFHTLETMLTDFGPKASNYHLKCAFITPTMHLWMDLMLLHPICMAMFIWPSYYGSYAYHHGAVLLVLEFIYWAVAYKDIVNKKRSKMKTV